MCRNSTFVLLRAVMILFLFPYALAGRATGWEEETGYEEVGCGNILSGCDPDEHRVPGPGWQYDSDPYRIHDACIICYDIYNEPLPASGCHNECDVGEDEDYQLAYNQLRRAMEELDVPEMMDLAGVVMRHAALNLERQSIQIFGCDGVHVIGNIPLSGEEMATATALLQEPDRTTEYAAGGRR